VNENCNKILKRLIPGLKSKESLFVTTSNDTSIVAGSYILTMPTTNGRTAQVIFAPGEGSLDDIKYMLEASNIDDMEVRTLERVRLIGKGEGCRFLSKKM
jgi:hypothetical protein